MKTLAPVAVMLILILAAVSALSAQEKIQNPQLPQNLVFQWKIKTDQVDASWKNDDFSIMRDEEGLIVFYGVYFDLSAALDDFPKLPEGMTKDQVELVPFFNQWSITADDALMLMSDRTAFDVGLLDRELLESVSFTVYFDTYEQPQGRKLMEEVEQPLSFEILPNYNYAYSAGMFSSLDEAEEYAGKLKEVGYMRAKVNKYLNGEKLAVADETELNHYIAWVGW